MLRRNRFSLRNMLTTIEALKWPVAAVLRATSKMTLRISNTPPRPYLATAESSSSYNLLPSSLSLTLRVCTFARECNLCTCLALGLSLCYFQRFTFSVFLITRDCWLRYRPHPTLRDCVKCAPVWTARSWSTQVIREGLYRLWLAYQYTLLVVCTHCSHSHTHTVSGHTLCDTHTLRLTRNTHYAHNMLSQWTNA